MELKKRLRSGETLLGSWCVIPSPHLCDVFSSSGMDFVAIDMEHGPIDCCRASEMVLSCRGKCEAIVRVPSNSEEYIQQVLDMGASGVIVPHIETPEQAEKAVSHMRYPPLGKRGFSPYTRAGEYAAGKVSMEEQNERALCMLLVENTKGIGNLEAIMENPEVDAIYVGAYDLSVSMGIPGEVNGEEMTRVIGETVGKIRKAGKIAALMAHTPEEFRKYSEMGAQMIFYKVDCAIFADSVSSFREKAGGGR
jgi:2-keto-3-deoxy-L-rhamnonate aldolase RhmA